MSDTAFYEIIRFRLKPGAEQRMLDMHDELINSYRDGFDGFLSAVLLKTETEGLWAHVWRWTSRDGANEAHLDQPPLFEEWLALVEFESLDLATVHDYHAR